MGSDASEELRITRYLLGQLSEEERSWVEERFFEDEEYEEMLGTIENDLVDEYVRGRLAPAERERFETFFLSSARRKQKVKFASALRQLESAPATGSTAPDKAHTAESLAPTETKRLPFLRSWRAILFAPAFRYSMAALLVVVSVAGLWLIFDRSRQRTQTAPPEQARTSDRQPPPSQTATPAVEQARTAPSQTAPEQATSTGDQPVPKPETGNNNQRVGPPDAGRQRAPSPVTATIFLAPGISRGGGQSTELALGPGTERARIRLGIQDGDDYPAYRVELRDPAGATVWSRNLTPGRGASRKSEIAFDIPARLLKTGKHELALQGSKGSGQFEDVAFYYFTVLNK